MIDGEKACQDMAFQVGIIPDAVPIPLPSNKADVVHNEVDMPPAAALVNTKNNLIFICIVITNSVCPVCQTLRTKDVLGLLISKAQHKMP